MPSTHSGGKNWQKVWTGDFEVSTLPAAFQISYTVHVLKGLIYKNLQNAAEGGMAPRPKVPTAVICSKHYSTALSLSWTI